MFVTYRLIIVNKHRKANLYSRSNRLCEWNHERQSHFPHCCSLQTTVGLSSKGWWVPARMHVDSEPLHAHHSSIPTSSHPTSFQRSKTSSVALTGKGQGRAMALPTQATLLKGKKHYSLTALLKKIKDQNL